MSKIALDRDSAYAPCCYLLCKAKRKLSVLKDEKGKRHYLWDWNTRDDKTTMLVQTDWDYPGVARSFGWNAVAGNFKTGDEDCNHETTDGTVTCKGCGKTSTDFISEAADYLDAHLGMVIDAPEYFEIR